MSTDGRIDMIMSALANKTRRSIIDMLAYRPSTGSELADRCNISLPGVQKHLDILEASDLIRRQKAGRTNFIALNPDSLQAAQDWIAKYQTHWGSRNETLENYISRFNNTNPSDDG